MDLKQFLESPFSKEDFINFIKKIFPNKFSENIYIEDGYLGQTQLDDNNKIGFFIFEVSENKNIETNRVGFHKELKKIAYDNLLDGAIGAFYNKAEKVWRLSFIRFSYDENHTLETTSQKRFTFLLGNTKIKTAFEQLKNLKNPKIVEIEKAFEVEAVTKEFYKGLVKEYEKLLNKYLVYPSNDENNKKEFVIRLIGRILFVKFLNKKSLVPDTIFDVCNGYYHEKLEPLFFQQLNTPKDKRKPEFANDSIPFLNGGLFEPLSLDYYKYNGVSNQFINMIKIDDNFFVELYEHLDQYNFTIDENSIEDNDLSIDPEMLGRIFENLLAEINPETSQNARKSTGSYYTPREIVDYMVNSSLLEYLKTKTDIDEEVLTKIVFKNQEPTHDYDKTKILSAIFELKIIDPACGSGAFPMGLLQRIVKILKLIDDDANIWFNLQNKDFREVHKNRNKNYIRKLSIIKNTIYGIDIQPIAIEISKLRFFLSLIVDEDGEPEPLPNLEFKFVCANTLIPMPQKPFASSLYYELEAKLIKLKNEYFEASGNRKEEIKKEYRQIQKEMLDEQETINLLSAIENKLIEYDPFDPVSVAGFFDSDFMFNIKDGFDIVIGNPPYIQLQKNRGELANLYKNFKYEVLDKRGDIYTLFYEKGINILKDGGHLCFITSNKWMRAGYGEKIRKFFIAYNPKILIDLGPGIFESATVDTNILLIQKSKNKNELKALILQKDDKQNIDQAFKANSVDLTNLGSDAWFVGSEAEQRLKKKIESIGKPLKDWDVKIYRGILTGLNEAFIITTEKRNEILANCKDEEERKRTEAIIRPILRGRDIKRYSYEWADLWVIGTFPALKLNIDDYPSIKKYFLDNFDIRQLEQSGKKYPQFNARKKTGNKWFETQDQIAYYPEFEKEKVVWGNISYDSQFSYVEKSIFVNAPANMIVSDKVSIKFLVGVMNSKIFDREFKRIGIFLGHAYEWKKQYIEQVKIPPITPNNESIVTQIETLVDEILTAKKQDPQADTKQLEYQIDQLVYQLYDLSEDEIKIIKGASK